MSLLQALPQALPQAVPAEFNATKQAVPAEFICPIAQEVMVDPVIGTDGYTYEREAITTWLRKDPTSPQTRQPMPLSSLIPNWALKHLIAEYMKTTAGAVVAKAAAAVPVQFSATLAGSYLTLSSTCVTPMETVLIAVVDTSGSMGSGASPPAASESDAKEAAVFSRLDLVKHCLKTVAAVSASCYSTAPVSLSIINFSEAASYALPLTKMTQTGLERANAAIGGLYEGGGTNIYAGLSYAIEEARKAAAASPNANIQIVLLTDGEPTPDYIPHGGITAAFKRKLDGLKANLSTFGFGYSLESKLLESLSIEGNGTYGFIPDCSMVGTVFINYCCAVLSTVANQIRVSGSYVGSLSAGQKRTVKVTGLTLGDTVEIAYGNQTATAVIEAGTAAAATERAALERLYTEVVRCCSARYDEGFRSDLTSLHAWISGSLPDGLLKTDILKDILSKNENEGQLLRAVSKKAWFDRWGLNHLISYSRALACEQTVNFKDATLQHFCGDLFRAIQDKANGLFADLPPPRSSITPHVRVTGQYMAETSNSANSGCFSGNCMVTMEDGGGKLVSLVERGDVLAGGAVVRAVIKTELTAATTPMVVFPDGLVITPWHPVKSETDEWVFPANVGKTQELELDAYYNFVLESGHIATIDGVQVCTLGHGIAGPVIGHPYFGTRAVLKDLEIRPGWDTGLVILTEKPQRDAVTGLVMRM